MRNEFIGYYQLNQDDHNLLWKNATIIFDTNVLLDLYRYKKNTRDDLLKVMESFKSRLFIPHHVALEFHRNRFGVIANQFNKFDRVKTLVNEGIGKLKLELKNEKLDKRHSDIELDSFISQLSTSADKLFLDLDKLKEKSLSPKDDDKILSRIERLCSRKVGKPYDATKIEEIYKDGEKRYSDKIPPGYLDHEKDGDFQHEGVLIKRKFGDLLIWKQMMDFASENECSDIIFVTSDVKDDWFWRVKGETKKCRPELTEEICRLTKVKRFKIYQTESFLKYAADFLGSTVDSEVLSDVKSVSSRTMSQKKHLEPLKRKSIFRSFQAYDRAVWRWLSLQGKQPYRKSEGYPDFEAYDENGHIGYEVKGLPTYRKLGARVVDDIAIADEYLRNSALDEINLVYVTSDEDKNFADSISVLNSLRLPDGISIIFGYLDESGLFREFFRLS